MVCPNFLGYTFAHLTAATAITAAGTYIPLPIENLALYILITLVIFVLLFAIMFLKPSPLKYALFIAFTALLGASLEPLVAQLKQKGLLLEVLLTTIGIFLTMALVGFADKDSFLGLGVYLFAGLIGIIFAQLLLFLLVGLGKISPATFAADRKPILLIAMAIFAFFTAYDVQILKRHARECTMTADYINESLGLYLDLINLFTSFGGLKG
jgi:FtsH-binding integral membrane protein